MGRTAVEIDGISDHDFYLLQKYQKFYPGVQFVFLHNTPIHESQMFENMKSNSAFMAHLRDLAEYCDSQIYTNSYDFVESMNQKKIDCQRILELLNKYNIANMTEQRQITGEVV